MAITQQPLQARLFMVTADKHGPQFAISYLAHLERESIIPLWVYCCGAEMQLHRQLPQRAQSLQEQPDVASSYDALSRLELEQHRALVQDRNATTQCAD